MNEERIKELLRRADAGGGIRVREGLAGRVRGMARRQRRVRVIGGMVTVVAMVGVGILVGRGGGGGKVVVDKGGTGVVVDHRAELARLEVEARVHLELAEQMWAAEEMGRKAREVRRVVVGPLELIERERQRAAMIIVDQADRHLLGKEPNEVAAKEYRAAVGLFPGTRGAEMARRRLEQIDNRKEG